MTACQIIVHPERQRDLAAAREVASSPYATRAQIRMAADLLSTSHDSFDRTLARELRAAMFAGRGAELSPEAQEIKDHLDFETLRLFGSWVIRGGILVALYVAAMIGLRLWLGGV